MYALPPCHRSTNLWSHQSLYIITDHYLHKGSAQVRALVHLGANACIIGRNQEKTERVAKDIATARQGSKVIGIAGVDVRKVEDLEKAVERCVKELGSLDFCMYGSTRE